MGVNMEVSHEIAKTKASNILQGFFILFVVGVIAALAINILNKTDGTVIVEDENNEACWTSSKDILNKNDQVKAVKCKEKPATKQSSTEKKTTETSKTKAKKTSTKK